MHGLSRSTVCGIFLDQGSNLWPLHWQEILIHRAAREVIELFFFNMLSRFAVALFADKGLHIKNYGFSSSRVQISVLDHKEG